MPTKTSSTDLLSVLNKHLVEAREGCVVGKWLLTLSADEQEAFKLVREKNELLSLTSIFRELEKSEDLPFALTSFRLHFRGVCSCPKTS